jgi:hypothetical protein
MKDNVYSIHTAGCGSRNTYHSRPCVSRASAVPSRFGMMACRYIHEQRAVARQPRVERGPPRSWMYLHAIPEPKPLVHMANMLSKPGQCARYTSVCYLQDTPKGFYNIQNLSGTPKSLHICLRTWIRQPGLPWLGGQGHWHHVKKPQSPQNCHG